jgi:hypothetical protein
LNVAARAFVARTLQRVTPEAIVPACEEWWRENSALVDELRLTPWEFPAYENPELDGDYKPDAAAIARYHSLKAAADKAKPKRKA